MASSSHTSLWSWVPLSSPRFTDEEAEAPRGEGACPEPLGLAWQAWIGALADGKGVCPSSHPTLPPPGSLTLPLALPAGPCHCFVPSVPSACPCTSTSCITKAHLPSMYSVPGTVLSLPCVLIHLPFPAVTGTGHFCQPHCTAEEMGVWKVSGVAVLQPVGRIGPCELILFGQGMLLKRCDVGHLTGHSLPSPCQDPTAASCFSPACLQVSDLSKAMNS